jgi:hypothetical protein
MTEQAIRHTRRSLLAARLLPCKQSLPATTQGSPAHPARPGKPGSHTEKSGPMAQNHAQTAQDEKNSPKKSHCCKKSIIFAPRHFVCLKYTCLPTIHRQT